MRKYEMSMKFPSFCCADVLLLHYFQEKKQCACEFREFFLLLKSNFCGVGLLSSGIWPCQGLGESR